MSCTQNFIVYDRVGKPIKGGWTVHAEILSAIDDSLIEEKTCTVDMTGECSVEIEDELLVNTWLLGYAKKGAETTLTAGTLPPCLFDTMELWRKVDCTHPTPYHSSGRELLIWWDKDKDGVLSESETEEAILAYLGYGEGDITINELDLIIECYFDYVGVIDDICPLESWWGKYGKAVFAGSFVLGLGAIAKVTIDSITKRIRR